MQRTNYRAPGESEWSTCTRFPAAAACCFAMCRGLRWKVCHIKSNTAIETETKAKAATKKEKKEQNKEGKSNAQRGKSKSKRIKSNLIIQIEITNQRSWHVDKRRRQRHRHCQRHRRLGVVVGVASRWVHGWESRIRMRMRTRDLHFQNRMAT